VVVELLEDLAQHRLRLVHLLGWDRRLFPFALPARRQITVDPESLGQVEQLEPERAVEPDILVLEHIKDTEGSRGIERGSCEVGEVSTL
jgi:hypothetical protein